MIGHKWSVTKETSACTDFDLKIVFISGKHVPLFGVMVEFRGDPFPHISYGVITATKSDMGKDYVGDDVRCFVSRNPNETHSGNTFWGHAQFCSGNRFWDYILEIYFERKFWIFSRLSPRGWDTSRFKMLLTVRKGWAGTRVRAPDHRTHRPLHKMHFWFDFQCHLFVAFLDLGFCFWVHGRANSSKQSLTYSGRVMAVI